ncbi:MAG: hypothetical protein B7X91_11380 [Hydrogenophilales bacterium 17-64-11]|nr:MAG: hypothetical protein B7X91_11380 [Hydrogenophilales bacterium 17-64-11]
MGGGTLIIPNIAAQKVAGGSAISLVLTSLFLGILAYEMKSLRHEITGTVWFPMLYRRMQAHPEENEPELPPIAGGVDRVGLRSGRFLKCLLELRPWG